MIVGTTVVVPNVKARNYCLELAARNCQHSDAVQFAALQKNCSFHARAAAISFTSCHNSSKPFTLWCRCSKGEEVIDTDVYGKTGAGTCPKTDSSASPIARSSLSLPVSPSISIPTGKPSGVSPIGRVKPGKLALLAILVLRE